MEREGVSMTGPLQDYREFRANCSLAGWHDISIHTQIFCQLDIVFFCGHIAKEVSRLAWAMFINPAIFGQTIGALGRLHGTAANQKNAYAQKGKNQTMEKKINHKNKVPIYG
jgi:hypothetical protein